MPTKQIQTNQDFTTFVKEIVKKQEKYSWGKSVVQELSAELQKEFVGVSGNTLDFTDNKAEDEFAEYIVLDNKLRVNIKL